MIVSMKHDGICWVVKYKLYNGSVISIDYNYKPSKWAVHAEVSRMYQRAKED